MSDNLIPKATIKAILLFVHRKHYEETTRLDLHSFVFSTYNLSHEQFESLMNLLDEQGLVWFTSSRQQIKLTNKGRLY